MVLVTSRVPDSMILLLAVPDLLSSSSGSILRRSLLSHLGFNLVIFLHFMKEIIQHVPPLNILLVSDPAMIWSCYAGSGPCSTPPIFVLLTNSSLLLLTVSIPTPTFISGRSELCRFLRCKGNCLRLDSKELFPSWRFLGGNGGRRFTFRRVGWGLVPG